MNAKHISQQHVDRYLNEFTFRHNNRIAVGVDDALRTERAIGSTEGKRLTYYPTKNGRGSPLVRGPQIADAEVPFE